MVSSLLVGMLMVGAVWGHDPQRIYIVHNPTATFTAPPTWTPRRPTLTPTMVPECAGDVNGDGQVTIDEIIRAVNAALLGCQ